MKEIWKKIDKDSNYEVSNLGNVKSLERTIIRKNGRKHHVKSKILKQYCDKSGYMIVCLPDDSLPRKKEILECIGLLQVRLFQTQRISHK